MSTKNLASQIKKFKGMEVGQLEELLLTENDAETLKAIESVITSKKASTEKVAEGKSFSRTGSTPEPKMVDVDKTDKPAKEVKPAKEPKPKKEVKVKVTEATAVITSKDPAVKANIEKLFTSTGKALETLKDDLVKQGIDVPFISFINKGDVVKFEAAFNSPHKGTTMEGIVTGNTDLDSAGRKYCKVKVEGKGTFQKSQSSVYRISLPKKEADAPAKEDKKAK